MIQQPLTTSYSPSGKKDIFSALLEALRTSVTPQQGIRTASDLLFRSFNSQGAILRSYNISEEAELTFEENVTPFHDPFGMASSLSGFIDQTIMKHLTAPGVPKEDIFTFNVEELEALVTYQALRQNEWVILLLWREKAWHNSEKKIVSYFWKTVALILEMENIYLTAIKRTLHDPATGALTWEGLKERISRSFPRLDRDGLAGTLILIQINGLSSLSKAHGPDIEDRALGHSISVIKHAVRPTDSIGRIGGSLFALWLDGADRFASAERAEVMTRHGIMLPFLKHTTLSLQMGLACREADSPDTIEDLLEQATLALRKTTSDKKGRPWYFAHQNA
ncbi:diguanylate cyclase [Aristophania vespae]|uniref:Diguanylate cyclase n=1 Tax=Aristophania vespae TaxID=2697033 RepID=A0A6P1NCV6_9PROT|nr:GGDEF domain-containing protein [Aristophania vespae]QHI95348.1 diguanylate cyclase [Aristophania vespae]UMM64617.1 hypothetical protein DM15PD_16330 [Aristophania vespae]